MAQPTLSPKLGTQDALFMWAEYTLLLLLGDQWEGLTQASQLQGLAVTTDHKPPSFMEDQLCRGRVVVLCRSCPLGALALGFPGWCRPRSVPHCVLPKDTLHDL